ncbi:MAG: GIY-YIG nuclease family protein [Oscillospiraceae bacterium]|nr:GIY-YIG nuclease family protein [Oscillospiraceae bacterium]
MQYYVYILASVTNVTLYIGVTRDLVRRVYEHKHNADPDSFTAKYNVHKLVYFEETTDVKVALEREKQLKGWRRSKKNNLVETKNPQWKDLYPLILGEGTD